MNTYSNIKAKGLPDNTSLYDHLSQVAEVSRKFAHYLNLDEDIAFQGAILHDIGKASSVFQSRLISKRRPDKPFRHEIASCFFLSLFDEAIHPQLIEMVIGHHKSILHDSRDLGILDLIEYRTNTFQLHIKDWDKWQIDALNILNLFGISTREITREEAENNFNKVVEYCRCNVKIQEFSKWRGLLMASDYFASALLDKTSENLTKIFKIPNLEFYSRTHKLYPLSLINSESEKPHTMVVACTGAGKTDYLFRRCRGRVFYTLPFQASINAMYKRVQNDLSNTNKDLDIRLLHASSTIELKGSTKEEKVIQGHIGSSIKILTPHQIASIVFGTKGFEAMALDIQGCDVILDEIHTYTDVTRAIVLKIVEVLKALNCRIHIGTATMPSILYNRIIEILGKDNVLEVKLDDDSLDKFDRHIINKANDWEEVYPIINDSVIDNKKILVVCNRIKEAQNQYDILKERYPNIPILLLHSRFKRGDRNIKEHLLLGIDEKGVSINKYNTSKKACIVVSTQVVEVSIDISFDVMFTQAAPLDSLIQRFGRVNRKRTSETIGKFKPIYVIAPPIDEKEALPYSLDIINKSYQHLPDGDILHERDTQKLIDKVFTEIDFLKIEQHSIYKDDSMWVIDKLTNSSKSIILDLLDIDSVSCICEADEEDYLFASYEDRKMMEITVRYYMVKDFRSLDVGSRPFVIPDDSYSEELGFDLEMSKKCKYNPEYSFL